jgi:hypothetical protein
MSTEEVENKHKEGPRWEIVRRCGTYREANEHRCGLLGETDTLQVKVHLMGPANKQFFAVKARVHPNIALEEELNQRRAAKKKRKAKLNKKRRKK